MKHMCQEESEVFAPGLLNKMKPDVPVKDDIVAEN